MRLRHALTLCCTALALAACGGDPSGPGAPRVASVRVEAPPVIERGAEVPLAADVRDGSGNALAGQTVTWTSSDLAVATVDAATGLLTAVGRGTTTVRATSDGKTGSAAVTVEIRYHSIALGEAWACDVGSGAVAACWGDNLRGQLGDGSTTPRPTPVNVLGSLGAATPLRFTGLALGEIHSCGVTAVGAAFCWGSNSVGQLGNPQPVDRTSPTIVANQGYRAITAGAFHTCTLDAAGVARCWGENGSGELGNGGTSDTPAPTLVSGGIAFQSIDAGRDFTCGVAMDRRAFCWGSNTNGQLGRGTPITYQTTDVSRVPVEVAGGHQWVAVSAATGYACGITTTGAAYCWGRNDYQGGNGGDDDSSTPVAVAGGHTFRAISSGWTSTCALTTANEAWCWGNNNNGELGAELPVDLSRVPVRAAGGLAFSEVAVAGSPIGSFACGISLDRLRTYCWGRNDRGQLGNGATTGANVRNFAPSLVTGQQP